ncbi:hypothetical protein PSI15_14500 [Xenorhabdus sp. PR6a]|uniref:hypothetical protein n=1 Tax=Xenorhabdus sp. PR6a TaxID=3025877 RepID=UPI0023595D68|nr:hypothetical protein [Xenorhabdus sp. PR6a]MDC9582760.1 hypothetical protein [Xenorhabdus sp. PR6a]
MNSELPKVDITYGTKRHGERTYKDFKFFVISATKGMYSVDVTTIGGDRFKSNIIKCNNRNSVIVFSDRRMLFCQIATITLIPRQEVEVVDSVAQFFDKSTLPKTKTFHLILNKSHAVEKHIAVFMKDGKIYKGEKSNHDYDSLQLLNQDGGLVLLMYDAVKRIVPFESDGSLAE